MYVHVGKDRMAVRMVADVHTCWVGSDGCKDGS